MFRLASLASSRLTVSGVVPSSSNRSIERNTFERLFVATRTSNVTSLPKSRPREEMGRRPGGIPTGEHRILFTMFRANRVPRLSVVVNNGNREPLTYSNSATARPGERHEPVAADVTPALIGAWREATLLRLPGPLGLSLLTETYLAEADLRSTFGREAPGALKRLDGLAADARLTVPTTGPSRDYLRTLLGLASTPGKVALSGTAIVPIPMRLVGRATEALSAAAGVTPMKRAIAWEVAAVASDRTVSEWVAWSLLDVSQLSRSAA